MTIQQKKQNDILILSPTGSLDVSVQKTINDELQKLIDKKEKDFVMDFEKVLFIDSSCLGTLASLLKKVRKLNGDLKLAKLSDDVLSIFQITRLNTVFELFDTVDEAVESFFR